MRKNRLAMAGVVALIAGALAIPAVAQDATCVVADTSTEEVAPGVVLSWDSSFWCADAPDAGNYSITGTVNNQSTQDVELDGVTLSHTTPPGSSGSAESESFPVTVSGGESVEFTVTGTYALVETDEGKKANLHLRITGGAGDEPFALGVNVALRAPGAVEDDGDDDGDDGDNGDNGGPPGTVPPPGDDDDDEEDASGLERAIAELREDVPGEADEVRSKVADMLEFIAGKDTAETGDDEHPGSFGQGVAERARDISGDDDPEEEENEDEEDEENEDEEEEDGGPRRPGPPSWVPRGRP